VKNRKYQELEYRVHTNELTMEFLLNMLKDWVQPGDRVFTAFAGTKILIAATV
jgi:DNA modification methylase